MSGGTIEVVGTLFLVEEHGRGGSVSLEEGHIRFVDHAGVSSALLPGQSHAWGDAVVATTAKATASPAVATETLPPSPQAPAGQPQVVTPPANARTLSFEEVIAEVDILQARNDERGAIALLRGTLARRDVSPAFEELLRFELISSLVRIKDGSALCQELAAYAREHGQGATSRFAAEIAGISAQANCGGR